MYKASFKYNKQEPEVVYFRAEGRASHKMEFKLKGREPIKFVINKDKLVLG